MCCIHSLRIFLDMLVLIWIHSRCSVEYVSVFCYNGATVHGAKLFLLIQEVFKKKFAEMFVDLYKYTISKRVQMIRLGEVVDICI